MRSIIFTLLLLVNTSAHAVLPQALTLVLHGVGGYLIAMVSDKVEMGNLGTPIALVVGAVKEVSDVNFNVPDFVMWPLGAELYKLSKQHPEWCWNSSDYNSTYWYIDYESTCLQSWI